MLKKKKPDKFPTIFPLGYYKPKPVRIKRPPAVPTRLEGYLKMRGIKPAHLAKECGYARQYLLRVRMGKAEPTRRCIAAIVVALRRISREYLIAQDFWDLGGKV